MPILLASEPHGTVRKMANSNGDRVREVRVDVEVYCGGCGRGLCLQTTAGVTAGRKQPFLTVQPCKHCLANARRVAARNVTLRNRRYAIERAARERTLWAVEQ